MGNHANSKVQYEHGEIPIAALMVNTRVDLLKQSEKVPEKIPEMPPRK